MKKLIAMLLTLVMALSLTACGESKEKTDDPSKDAGEPSSSKTYKETMGDVSTFDQELKVVVFQNLIKPGFLNGDKAVTAETKTVDGKDLKAYPIAAAIDMFLNKPAADVTIIDADGKTRTVSADAFKSAYIALTDDGAGIFLADGITVPNFKYAVAEDKEALIFVNPSETLVMKDVLEAIGAKADAPKYRFVATDKFYLEVETDECANSEIRGTLSGAVNASLPIATASGKLNDVLYVDIIEG